MPEITKPGRDGLTGHDGHDGRDGRDGVRGTAGTSAMSIEDREDIKRLVKESIADALADFHIPAEEHYQQHLWITRMMDYQETIQSNLLKTVVQSIIMALLMLLLLGFIFWGKTRF